GCFGFTTSAERFNVTMISSRRQPFIAVVQTTDLRNSHDLAPTHNFSWRGGILFQTQVRSRPVLIDKVALQDLMQVLPTQYHHMVQTLTADRTDQALDIHILPGTVRCGENLLRPQRLDTTPEFRTIGAVTAPYQVSGHITISKCLYHLLSHPL